MRKPYMMIAVAAPYAAATFVLAATLEVTAVSMSQASGRPGAFRFGRHFAFTCASNESELAI